jgi:hypothetical protein
LAAPRALRNPIVRKSGVGTNSGIIHEGPARNLLGSMRDGNFRIAEIVFLIGPPKYVSRTWPSEVADGDASHGQWGETVKRFLAAA